MSEQRDMNETASPREKITKGILSIFLLVRSVNVHWWLLEVGGLGCPVAQANVLLINTAS